jgi:hypothetical protein
VGGECEVVFGCFGGSDVLSSFPGDGSLGLLVVSRRPAIDELRLGA